jgi:hypothetical protein
VPAWATVRFILRLNMFLFASLFSVVIAAPPDLGAGYETGSSATADAAAVLFVEDYLRLPDVDGASRDAALMADTFRNSVGIPASAVKLTSTGNRSRMRSTVQSAAKKVKKNGTLWVYFSGHGLVRNGEWVLLGKDTVRDGSTATRDGIKLKEIVDWSKRSTISRVVVILDASFGGYHRDGSRVISPPPPRPPRFQTPNDDRVVVWMADAKARTAPHYRAADHGMFSYLVAGALRGWADGALGGSPDGLLSLGELQRFVRLHTHALGSAHAANESDIPAQSEWTLVSGKMESGPGVASWAALAKVEQNLQMVQALGGYKARAQAAYEMAVNVDDPEVRKESIAAFLKTFGRPEVVIRSSIWLPEIDMALRELAGGSAELSAPVVVVSDKDQVSAEPGETAESKPAPVVATRPPPVVATRPPPVVVELPPPPGLPTTCKNLLALEPFALMGQLSGTLRACLEERLNSADQQTVQNKISRVLMMDAEARRDHERMAMLLGRHLQDIDRSDPDLCFKYALVLSKKGIDRSEEVIHWADYALENKQEWTRSTYKRRLFDLFKLRAETANKLWNHWDATYVKDRTGASQGQSENWRNTTKQYSREWLDYAKASKQRIKRASNLCIAAAGTSDFCEAESED